jgi:hypothetical protein
MKEKLSLSYGKEKAAKVVFTEYKNWQGCLIKRKLEGKGALLKGS